METITFKCTACKFPLKVGADRAGRAAKCSKCGATQTVPAKNGPAPPSGVPKNRMLDEEDDGPMTYAVKDEAKPEMPDLLAGDEGPTTLKGPGRVIGKRQAKITDGPEWKKVGLGTQIIAGGLCVWLAAFMLYRVPLVLGLAFGEQYAPAAENHLVTSDINAGTSPDLDQCSYAVTLVSGGGDWAWGTIMIWVVRLSFLLTLLQFPILLAGYFVCLTVPERYGTRMQLFVLMGLCLANGFFFLVFKLLPMFGLYHYTILTFACPEAVMVEMNAERVESLATFWMRWPLLEVFWSMVMTSLLYLEPALIGVFVYACARSIKQEPLQDRAFTVMQLGFSQIFIQTIWLMAALCGTSIVLLWVLRFVYCVGAFFFMYQLIYCIITLFMVPGYIREQLGDEDEDQGEEDEEEEDED